MRRASIRLDGRRASGTSPERLVCASLLRHHARPWESRPLQQLAYSVENGVFVFAEVFYREDGQFIRLHTVSFQASALRSVIVHDGEMNAKPAWQFVIRGTQNSAT